jgi:RNA polymerase sigma factor FliA
VYGDGRDILGDVNDAQRASLVESHRFLVWKAVRLVWPRVKGHVERDDLVSLGDLGLVEASTRYAEDAGASFATFAWYRVQGAIVDGLRRSAVLPRRIWAQLCALRAAGEYLEARARQDTAARAAGAPVGDDTESRLREVKDAMAAVQAMYVVAVVPIDAAAAVHDPAESPDTGLDRAAWAQRVSEAVDTLPERERALVVKHYFEGKNLLEAGEELGISKSWASRIHAQAVERLRKRLGPAP